MRDLEVIEVITKYINKNLKVDDYDRAKHHALNILKAMEDKKITCEFCENPCGNDHCPVANENKKDK